MNERVTVKEASEQVRLSADWLREMIEAGILSADEKGILKSDVKKMMWEQETYVTFYEFATAMKKERFDGQNEKHRRRLMHHLNKNEWFGVDVKDWQELLIGYPKKTVYIRKEQIPYLTECLKEYLASFDKTAKEKYEQILLTAKGKETTRKAFSEYRKHHFELSKKENTVLEAVKILMQAEDLKKLTNAEIKKLLKASKTSEARKLLIDFLNESAGIYPVRYDLIYAKKAVPKPAEAYENEVYLGLAKCIFNAEHIETHQMIQKALKDHLYAEMWLYISIFYACGWRSADICTGWMYLKLYEREETILGICKETLYEDILEDRIPHKTYENVCRYALKSIEVSENVPSKTAFFAENPLLAVITEELYGFYGLLTLIGECHRLRSEYGYMDKKRKSLYQNRMKLKEFFGSEITSLLKGKNLETRRLNKDYLQGIELAAKQNGCGAMLASSVASYARNHKSLDTIKSYLKDHNLTGESAEMVLYFMMDRGVFGFEYYQMLVTAYPDSIKQLPISSQNKLIQHMRAADPLMLELLQSEQIASETVSEYFLEGKKDAVLAILKSMYEISQNRGKGKDFGVYCLLRAEKKACTCPMHQSCLANGCRNLVFTKLGYLPLLKLLNDYQKKGKAGDLKAQMVLKQVLIPRYQEILNQLISEMDLNRQERSALVSLMKEELNG